MKRKGRQTAIMLAVATAWCVLAVGCNKENAPPAQTPSAPTQGIVYELSADGTYAKVTDYTGTETDVRIAATYENVPVVRIEDSAFYGQREMTSVVIPDSVTEIGDSAFYNCSALKNIVLPDSLETVGYSVFGGCEVVAEITLPFAGESADGTGNTHFGYLFGASSYEENVDFVPQTLRTVTVTATKSIPDWAFFECRNVTKVILPDDLESIGVSAFRMCDQLPSVFIPESVMTIGKYAFAYCYSITIYCEVESKPIDWDVSWNYDFPVVWGYAGE